MRDGALAEEYAFPAVNVTSSHFARRARPGLPHRGLLFGFRLSVTSDGAEIVPVGGELTLFEAVDPVGV
jgi:hypothetical protein